MNFRRQSVGPFAVGLVVGLAALSASSSANASGYLVARYGGDLGTPVSRSPYAIYFNPAALGGMQGTQITLDVLAGARFATYKRTADALTPGDQAARRDPSYASTNTGENHLTNILALPFFGVATDFGGSKVLRFGIASYVPFGGIAKWDKNDSVKGQTIGDVGVDGPQRWHNIEGSIFSIFNTAALAIHIPNTGWSFGVNGSLVYSTVETLRARNSDGSDDVQVGNNLREGRAYIHATGWQAAAAAGVYYESKEASHLRLGASYTIRPGFGQMRLAGTLRQQFGGTGEESKPTNIEFLQTFPDVFRVGAAALASPRVEVRGDLEYVTWSVFKRQCLVSAEPTGGQTCNLYDDGSQPNGGKVLQNIPRNWNDTLGLRAGAAYFFDAEKHTSELFGSVGFKTPAASKEFMDATTIDTPRLTFAFGGRREFGKLALGASANFEYFVPTSTEGQQRFGKLAAPSRSPGANGTYEQIILFANLNATYTF